MSNGPEQSLDTAQVQLQKLDRILDEYEEKHGIKRPDYNEEVDDYLALTKEQMVNMTMQECVIARFLLEQHAFHIQKTLNKEVSRAKWCAANIEIAYATRANEHRNPATYQSKEELKGLVVAGNTYTKKMNQLLIEAENRIARLQGLPEKISYMSNTLRSLEYSKSGK